MASALFALVLLGSVVSFMIVALLIWRETSSTTVTNRAEATRQAREFGGRDGSSDHD